jgi:hypothetical protein
VIGDSCVVKSQMEDVFLIFMLVMVVVGPIVVFGFVACVIEQLVKEPSVIESCRRRGDVEYQCDFGVLLSTSAKFDYGFVQYEQARNQIVQIKVSKCLDTSLLLSQLS